MRRPARRGRRHPDPADRRGRRAAQPGPAHHRRPGHPRRHRPPGRPGHRRGLPGNPLSAPADPNARRIIAYGLRNPFRFDRPARHQRDLARRRRLEHLGGDQPHPQPDRRGDQLRLALLRGQRAPGAATTAPTSTSARTCTRPAPARSPAPYYAYHHRPGRPRRDLPDGRLLDRRAQPSTDRGGNYPADYDGALFFADYSRDCIWVMHTGADGLPDPANRTTFVAAGQPTRSTWRSPGRRPVLRRLRRRGTVRRISYAGANTRRPRSPRPPRPAAPRRSRSASTAAGPATPTATPSPTPGTWTATAPSTTPPAPPPAGPTTSRGTYTASAAGHRQPGGQSTPTRSRSPPATPRRRRPSPARPPRYTGRSATPSSSPARPPTRRTAPCPPRALSWRWSSTTAPANCHTPPVQTFAGVARGSFAAPDHEYPSYLELPLTATDSGGLTDTETVRLDPQTVDLTFQTSPGGLAAGGRRRRRPRPRSPGR